MLQALTAPRAFTSKASKRSSKNCAPQAVLQALSLPRAFTSKASKLSSKNYAPQAVLQALSLPRAFAPEKFALDKAKERLGLEPPGDRSSKGFKKGLSVDQQRAADELAAATHAAEVAGAALMLLRIRVQKYKYRQMQSLQPGKLKCATS